MLTKREIIQFGEDHENVEIEEDEVTDEDGLEWSFSLQTDEGISGTIEKNTEPNTTYSDGHFAVSQLQYRSEFPPSVDVFKEVLDQFSAIMGMNVSSDGIGFIRNAGFDEEELPHIQDIKYGEEGKISDVEKFRRLVEDGEFDDGGCVVTIKSSTYLGDEPESVADIENQLEDMRAAVEKF